MQKKIINNESKLPKVSVIIPVYKEMYLVECINSVLKQTLREIEIIIVDKGKKNRCQEIVDYYASKDPRIVAPHIENDGYGASANIGIKLAKGEYIAIVESDDFIEPEMYEEMYAYAKELDADVVKTPCYEFFDDKPKQECCYRKFMSKNTPENLCFSMKDFGEMLQIHASIWSGIYRTQYLKDNGIFFIEAPGAGYIDVGFRIHTLIHSNKIAWLDKLFYNYRVDSNSSSTNQYNLGVMLKRWKEVHEYFKDYQEDYDKYYGKYLILDEYKNSIYIAMRNEFTGEDIDAMKYNFSFVKNNVIEESNILSNEQKKNILMFKKDPDKFVNSIYKKRLENVFEAPYNVVDDMLFRLPPNVVSLYDKIVIYGAGAVGRAYTNEILKNGYCQILAVCDKNYLKIKSSRVDIISPRELSMWDYNKYDNILISVEKKEVAYAIRKELEELGIKSNKIKWVKPMIEVCKD